MNKGIWIFIEHAQGKIRKSTLELLTGGRKIADAAGEPLTAVILGEKVDSLVEETAAYRVDTVILAEHPALACYTLAYYTSLLTKMIRQGTPQAVLFSNTSTAKDLAPRLAQRLNVGLASDCTGINVHPDTFLHFIRPVYAGKAFAHVSTQQRPILATVRPNTFEVNPLNPARQLEVIRFPVQIDVSELKTIVREIIPTASTRPGLTEARIIVAGGRGLRGPENFALLEDLADTLGAAVGVSRSVVDSGWKEHEFQVGQTGKTVAPTLYIACGISGAIQHLAGMGSSKYIVAINKDPEANIFKVADYGIVGDLFEIVPLLTLECQKLLAKR